MPPIIRQARITDIEPTARLIAAAFNNLDAARWLVPDAGRRPTVLAANFRILVEHALLFGLVDIIDDGPISDDSDVRLHVANTGPAAVAVWFDRTEPLPEPGYYDLRLEAATGNDVDHFKFLDKLFAEHHPAEPPHDHLALLAVDPPYQGCGLGTALLNHHHTQRPDTPAYLEASSPRSRDLYMRFGYQVLKTISLPNGTKFWLMWRAANSAN
ncbi:GNAT family N-acetyltransferase [Nonomuraea sp. NPDC026600]|uniref:GNAT family N-acetyltransferase n=1 Tax=Nonomuraea sp. NPDC026600 TaxID=3155363 RepID=UPI0033E03688